MVLRQITVLAVVGRNGDTYGRRHQPIRFVGALTIVDAEDDLPRTEELDSFFPGNSLATRRVNAGDQHEVAISQPRHSQSELERGQSFFVDTGPFCEKALFRNHFLSSIT